MPPLPVFDFVGLSSFFSLMLISLSVIWGLHKAINFAK